MGTRTRTKTDTHEEELTRYVVETTKLVDEYKGNDYIGIWKLINHSTELISLKHCTSTECTHIWRKAFKVSDLKEEDSKADNNNWAIVASRVSIVGMFFALNNVRSKELYEKWHNKCGIHSIYYKVKELEKKAKKRIDKRQEMSKEQLQKEADEGVVNAKELADNTIESVILKPNKKEETKSWTAPPPNLDRELSKQNKKLYMGEPYKFFRMMARIISADVNPISDRYKLWRKAADNEMKLE